MPYNMKKVDDEWCVFNSHTGEKKGCSDSQNDAKAHMRALYAAENKDMTPEEIDLLVKEAVEDSNLDEEMVQKYYDEPAGIYVPWSATSYADVEEMRDAQERAMKANELIGTFPALARNIIESDEISDKGSAIETLASELADLLDNLQGEMEKELKAISKREDVSEADKKRAQGEYGDVKYADTKNKKYPIDTVAHIRAAWNYINMPRNAKKYSASDVAAIKSRIVAAWKDKIDSGGPPSAKKGLISQVLEKLTGKSEDQENLDKSQINVWKSKDGKWLWFARYSNNFRDRDNPPEIISAKSHRHFVERVDKGLAPYPELWLWHVKDWAIGKATWVAYDDAGFALAAGYGYPGCEQAFEWLAKQTNFAVSHGMPVTTIRRDYEDPTVIVEHETREISPLPQQVAANMLTDFVAFNTQIKEDNMSIPATKRETLISMFGLPEEVLATIESMNASDASKARDEGIESKEVDETTDAPVEETKVEEEQVNPEPVDEEDAEPQEENPEDLPPTRKEVADAFKSIFDAYMQPVKEQLEALQGLPDQVKSLTDRLDESEKRALKLEQTLVGDSPKASLAAMLIGGVDKSKSAKISESDELNGSKPKEAETSTIGTGIPFIDQMLASS